MTNIGQALSTIEATELIEIKNRPQQWRVFCEHYDSIFTLARTRNAEASDKQLLLGVLTKAHIEALVQIENNEKSANVVREAIATHLGKEHQHRFTYQGAEQLIFITHLWLYLQGCMNMDFSLASDYADQTVLTLTEHSLPNISEPSSQPLRLAFMASFYEGKNRAPNQSVLHKLSQKVKQWLS
ncbi:hypothetical protein DZ860_14400 [Vibrio sinensis]|uniref:Uncharacterized protein n=1 Tax=Vibrio sinensis TaxID=2302434 RepID=A0A3A6R0B7_9VIBR|nr:hypothetical protein [Vibrio sinensis]RJX69669.1 hypothetical protein DZ860_14400 [Vibrio sinensis]